MKYFYTWQEFDRDIERIAAWAGERNFKSVYGISRRGLIVGVALSHRLGLPLKLKVEEIEQETLVVDDIADSGRTLENLVKVLNFKPVVAVLFYHKDTRRMSDFYYLWQNTPRLAPVRNQNGNVFCLITLDCDDKFIS